MKKLNVLFFAVVAIFSASSARAMIVDGAVTGQKAFNNGGIFIMESAPIGPVGKDNYQDFNLHGFNEAQAFTLTDDIFANISYYGLDPHILPAGLVVDSHFGVYDPLKLAKMEGWMEFDGDVIGIITKKRDLIDSDFLGEPTADYLSPGKRGLEPGNKVYRDPNNSKRVIWDTNASSPGDSVRILTAATAGTEPPGGGVVPEPATLSLLGLGLIGSRFIRRKR